MSRGRNDYIESRRESRSIELEFRRFESGKEGCSTRSVRIRNPWNTACVIEDRGEKKEGTGGRAIGGDLRRLFSFFLIPYRATFFRNCPSLGCCVTVPHKDSTFRTWLGSQTCSLDRGFASLWINKRCRLQTWKDAVSERGERSTSARINTVRKVIRRFRCIPPFTSEQCRSRGKVQIHRKRVIIERRCTGIPVYSRGP